MDDRNAHRTLGNLSLSRRSLARSSSPFPMYAKLIRVRPQRRQRARNEKQLPPHWQVPRRTIPRIVFVIMCLVAFGQPHLKDVWKHSQQEHSFRRLKGRLIDRITTITVIAGLLLGTTAAFVTTPPPVSDVINYSSRAPYYLTLLSLGTNLGGLVAGSTIIYVCTEAKRRWFLVTIMTSRSKVCCCLILVGYPFFSVGGSTTYTALALFAAAWATNDVVTRVGTIIGLLAPASMVPMFLWTQRRGGPWSLGSPFIDFASQDDLEAVGVEEEMTKSASRTEITAEPILSE